MEHQDEFGGGQSWTGSSEYKSKHQVQHLLNVLYLIVLEPKGSYRLPVILSKVLIRSEIKSLGFSCSGKGTMIPARPG